MFDSHEYAIQLTAGEACFASGLESTASLFNSIETEWSHRYTDGNPGIAAAGSIDAPDQYVTLINPARVVAIVDLRDNL